MCGGTLARRLILKRAHTYLYRVVQSPNYSRIKSMLTAVVAPPHSTYTGIRSNKPARRHISTKVGPCSGGACVCSFAPLSTTPRDLQESSGTVVIFGFKSCFPVTVPSLSCSLLILFVAHTHPLDSRHSSIIFQPLWG